MICHFPPHFLTHEIGSLTFNKTLPPTIWRVINPPSICAGKFRTYITPDFSKYFDSGGNMS